MMTAFANSKFKSIHEKKFRKLNYAAKTELILESKVL